MTQPIVDKLTHILNHFSCNCIPFAYLFAWLGVECGVWSVKEPYQDRKITTTCVCACEATP